MRRCSSIFNLASICSFLYCTNALTRSIEYKDEYEAAKVAAEKAVEVSTHNYNKRRGINTEIKQFKEQKSEAERFAKLQDEKDQAVIHHLVWKLYHIQEQIDEARTEIEEKNAGIADLRQEQEEHEDRLRKARKEVASAQKHLHKQEKEVKKRERDLEEKVRSCFL